MRPSLQLGSLSATSCQARLCWEPTQLSTQARDWPSIQKQTRLVIESHKQVLNKLFDKETEQGEGKGALAVISSVKNNRDSIQKQLFSDPLHKTTPWLARAGETRGRFLPHRRGNCLVGLIVYPKRSVFALNYVTVCHRSTSILIHG